MLQLHAPPLLRQATGESDPLRVGDAASLPPPIALPPAVGSLSVHSGSKALLLAPPSAASAATRTTSQFAISHASSAATARAAPVMPSTVLAVANARGSLRQLSQGPLPTEPGCEAPPALAPLHPPTAPGAVPLPLRSSVSYPSSLEATPGLHRSPDDGLAHGAHATPGVQALGGHSKGSTLQLHVFHTAALDGVHFAGTPVSFPATGTAAAVTPQTPLLQHALSIAGADTPATPSAGLGLDPSFLLALKDFASRLMRTRPERTALCETVAAAFFQAAHTPPPHPSHVNPTSGAPASSAVSITHSHTIARSAMLGDSQRKRLEARLPSILKGLRDMAINLCSVREDRRNFL